MLLRVRTTVPTVLVLVYVALPAAPRVVLRIVTFMQGSFRDNRFVDAAAVAVGLGASIGGRGRGDKGRTPLFAYVASAATLL